MTRVLVCGGRDFNQVALLDDTLDYYHDRYKFQVLIEGGARGADTLAGDWAKFAGVPLMVFPADWETFGKGAGYVRNRQMLDEGKPNLVIAFEGGRGTAHMIRAAKQDGVKVIEV